MPGDINILFASDLTKKGEEKLIKKRVDLRSRLLKVGHHGACDATSEMFLDAVRPDVAVVTVSNENRFGYPCKETMELLAKKDIQTIRTDSVGTVVFKSDGKRIWLKK